MKKRYSAIILSLVMAAALAGCGDSSLERSGSSKVKSSDTVSSQSEKSGSKNDVADTVEDVTDAVANYLPTGEPTQTGTCGANGGDNVKWSLYEDGTVVVEGEGEMAEYTYESGANNDTNVLAHNDSINKVVFTEGITKITDLVYDCPNITSVKIPSTVKELDMRDLTGVEEIEFPEGLEALKFQGAESLEKIKIPSTVTQLNLDYCILLKGLELPSNLETISCYECSALENIVLPESIKELKWANFLGCTNLKTVAFSGEPKELTEIGDGVFKNCSSLTEITIPEGITVICRDAFHDCASLERVSLPESLTTIERHAFDDCTSLTEITIPGGVSEIDKVAFIRCDNLQLIRGKSGSAAEEFANEKGIAFEAV